jgi:hypothetical protein
LVLDGVVFHKILSYMTPHTNLHADQKPQKQRNSSRYSRQR